MNTERSSFRFFTRTGLLALLLFTFVLSGLSQSIADVARRERQRQNATQSKVVVTSTSNNVASNKAPTQEAPAAQPTNAAAPAANATTAQTTPAASGSGAKPGEVTDRLGHNEKYWRDAFQKARDDLKRAESKAELYDLRAKQLNTDLLQQSNLYNRENRIGAELTATQKDLDDAKKDVELAKKKISDLEEDLRKAGGPAGWAR